MKKHHKFSSAERDLLANLLAQNTTKSECARIMNRPRPTIVNEVMRNGCWLKEQSGRRVFVYVAIAAQAKATKRQINSTHNRFELKNPAVYSYVTKHLRKGWSPEQISGRLKKIDFPDDPEMHINHETIYQWIYKQPLNEEHKYWYEYLRRKQTKRRKRKGRSVHRSRIPDRISISKRSEAVNNRLEFGHWEGDSVEGKRGLGGHGLHTEVERVSRVIRATKIKNLTSRQAYYAQCRIFGSEPSEAVKSTTLDNGRETHEHYRLRKKFNMITYHAHPYASYERGTNEHGNWHLRYYFPKGTDFAKVSRNELQAVVGEVNDRPRKIHQFLSANEVYYKLLRKV